jgi:hypothetical protein
MSDETTTTTTTAPATTAVPVTQAAPAAATTPTTGLEGIMARLEAAEKRAAELEGSHKQLYALRQQDALRSAVPDLLYPDLLQAPMFAAAKETDALGSLTPAAVESLKKIRETYPALFTAKAGPGIPETQPLQTAMTEISKEDWRTLYRTDPKKALAPETQAALDRWVKNHPGR